MDQKQNPEEFYKNLKVQLEEGFEWPHLYLYKFIFPASDQKIAEIENIFDSKGAMITLKESAQGKYVSVSIKVVMDSAQEVIDKYVEVGEKVTDVISL